MKATQKLKEEHDNILSMLEVVEKIAANVKNGQALNAEHFSGIIDFIKGYADECHHVKEEGVLFPAMQKYGFEPNDGPIAVMLEEHDAGRNFIKTASEALVTYKNGNNNVTEVIISKAMSYVHLLRNHIIKENNVLYMMADKVIDETEQNEMYKVFEKLDREQTGISKIENYLGFLKELEGIYL